MHARTHAGETALHLAAASGHLDICKMLLQRTGLQLKGPAAESIDTTTPLQLAGTAMHWQMALQMSAFVCGPFGSAQGALMASVIQEGLQRRLNAPEEEAGSRRKARGNARVASVAGVVGREFRGPSFTGARRRRMMTCDCLRTSSMSPR